LNEETMDDRNRNSPGASPPQGDNPDGDGGYPALDGFDSNGYPTGTAAPSAGGAAPPAVGGYPPAVGGYPPTVGGYPPAVGEHNPYAPPGGGYPPQGGYGHEPYWQPYELAGRGTRLVAAILDGLLAIATALPGFILLYDFLNSVDSKKESDLWLAVGVMVVGVLVLAIYQWYLIATRGQSLGKKWLHIRIVKLDGSMPGFVNGVLLRGWVMSLITNIPYVGGIVGLVDPLLIFGQERRCLHDLIASTQVIVGDPPDELETRGQTTFPQYRAGG
jgi:uncharacterized RDD family membrane protein YckC